MQVLKYILIVIDVIVAMALIIITLMQHKDDPGLSSTITGASANNFLDKNKGRTKEGRLKKVIIICSIVILVLTVAFYVIEHFFAG